MRKPYCDVCGSSVDANTGAVGAVINTRLRTAELKMASGQTFRFFITGSVVSSNDAYEICSDCISHAASMLDARPKAAT